MRSIYHSVGRCFFAVHLLVTMTKSALGPRLGFRGYPKVNTLGVKCFWRKVYATLGVSCYLFFSCWFDSVELDLFDSVERRLRLFFVISFF